MPGAGAATAKGVRQTAGGAHKSQSVVVCTASTKIAKAGRYKLACKLTAAARSLRRKQAIRVKLSVTYTPTGGSSRTVTRRAILRKTSSGVTG